MWRRRRLAWLVLLGVAGGANVARAQDIPQASTVVGQGVAGDWRRVAALDAHGFHVERWGQWVEGVRVEGAERVTRTRADGRVDVDRVEGAVAVEAPLARVDWEPLRSRAEVLALQTVGLAGARVEAAEPRWASDGVRITPAWAFDVAGVSLAQRMRVVVGIAPLAVLRVEDRVLDVRGRVYARNPVSDDGVTVDVELAPLTDSATLTGAGFTVRSCDVQPSGACEPVARAVPDAAGDFLLTPDPGSWEDGFAEVMAFHHANLAADRLERDHGFRWRCAIDDSMWIYTNFAEAPRVAYPNAAFVQGTRDRCGYLLFGQASTDFAYDADVVYHELGHAVTDQLAGVVGFAVDSLGMHYQPLGINEGTSDYWAATIQGDPRVGESLMGLDGFGRSAALREIDGGLRCPDDLVGQAHFDGRIWSGAFWTLREELGAEKIDALVYTTIASIGSAPDFADGAELAIVTAEGLRDAGTFTADDVERVRAVLEERGLVGCRRIVSLDDGATRAGYSGVPLLTAGLGRGIAPTHYAIDLPADAVSATVTLRRTTVAGTHRVHARRGRPVALVSGRIVAEDQLDVGRSQQVIFDGTSPAWAPCTTLYLAVETLDLDVDQSLYAISATVERSGDPAARCADPMPDAGVSPDAPTVGDDGGALDAGPVAGVGGGCGCRASGAPRRGLGALALGALAAVFARRRRR
ncbi:MAG: hypothetical protein OHK0013_21610 [Sandaracinaceae bacterium]